MAGRELEGLTVEHPAASVRLLVPSSASGELVLPAWNGNEFLLADGRRPVIRTFTPRRLDPDGLELDIEVVIHGRGAATEWAEAEDDPEARAAAEALLVARGGGAARDEVLLPN